VHFRSSAGLAALPASHTLASADKGSHVFTATLNTVGTQWIMATDTSKSTTTGTESGIRVTAATMDLIFKDWSDDDDEGDGVPDLMETRDFLEQVALATIQPASFLEAAQHHSPLWESAGIDESQALWATAALGMLWWSLTAESKDQRRNRQAY